MLIQKIIIHKSVAKKKTKSYKLSVNSHNTCAQKNREGHLEEHRIIKNGRCIEIRLIPHKLYIVLNQNLRLFQFSLCYRNQKKIQLKIQLSQRFVVLL
jgi:hypothetical protein